MDDGIHGAGLDGGLDGMVFEDDVLLAEPPTLSDLEAAGSLSGHYALEGVSDGAPWFARDPLGVHKLFIARVDGTYLADRQLLRLLERATDHDAVWSVPPGHVLRAEPGPESRFTVVRRDLPSAPELERVDDPIAPIRTLFRTTLDQLAPRLSGPTFVTLSGGLDSSAIAALALEALPDLQAITFRIGEGRVHADEDLACARLVAKTLGLPLQEVVVTEEEVRARLDEVLVSGQDHRDFNVHCALVNACLGAALPRGATVLTGDGSNELFADYEPVELEGRVHYPLPRLSRSELRRYLVAGLDVGDREVGVFRHHGVAVVQPYLLCADAFARLPGAWLDDRRAKTTVLRQVTEGRLPEKIYQRPKVRAQCARPSGQGGTLSALADVDDTALRQRFATLHGVEERWVKSFFRLGRHRPPPLTA